MRSSRSMRNKRPPPSPTPAAAEELPPTRLRHGRAAGDLPALSLVWLGDGHHFEMAREPCSARSGPARSAGAWSWVLRAPAIEVEAIQVGLACRAWPSRVGDFDAWQGERARFDSRPALPQLRARELFCY